MVSRLIQSLRQPHRLPRRTVALRLVIACLAVAVVPLYLVSDSIRDNAARLEAQIELKVDALASVATPGSEVQNLERALAKLQEPAKAIARVEGFLAAKHIDWPAVMAAISNYDATRLALQSISQEGRRIQLRGRAINDRAVVSYASDLQSAALQGSRTLRGPRTPGVLDLFSRVIIQAVKVVDEPFTEALDVPSAGVGPEITLTPGAVLSPTLTPSPTPILGDEYEPDDSDVVPSAEPSDIILRQTQLHSFYPTDDVDKVTFLAKVRRFYRVSTSKLAPGVDTFLSVSVGGIVYSNDDRRPTDLSSELVFQVNTNYEVKAVVEVSNKGLYGPDQWYEITVEEIIATPTPVPPPTLTRTYPSATPTATATPPATATNTPIPTDTSTPTPIPTNTATPTFDLRDEYEPDDYAPKAISVGETQAHTFYPDGDVDKVKFLASAGRSYRVFTSGLVPDVDTFLVVTVGGTYYVNDNRQLGDLSSELVFQVGAGQDAEAVVEVSNKGRYGPGQRYQITVEEIVPTPTLIPTPKMGYILQSPTGAVSGRGKEASSLQDSPHLSDRAGPRSPGLASIIPNLTFVGDRKAVADVLDPSSPPAPRELGYLAAPSTNAPSPKSVEFVIVLEVKVQS